MTIIGIFFHIRYDSHGLFGEFVFSQLFFSYKIGGYGAQFISFRSLVSALHRIRVVVYDCIYSIVFQSPLIKTFRTRQSHCVTCDCHRDVSICDYAVDIYSRKRTTTKVWFQTNFMATMVTCISACQQRRLYQVYRGGGRINDSKEHIPIYRILCWDY